MAGEAAIDVAEQLAFRAALLVAVGAGVARQAGGMLEPHANALAHCQALDTGAYRHHLAHRLPDRGQAQREPHSRMRSVSGGPHLMACHLSRGPQVHQVGGAHTTCENLGKNIELSQLGGNTLSRNEHLRHMDVPRAEIAKR